MHCGSEAVPSPSCGELQGPHACFRCISQAESRQPEARIPQVLAGQKDMVRFFVAEKRLLPIDVRAVHSGHTPLLSLAAFR